LAQNALTFSDVSASVKDYFKSFFCYFCVLDIHEPSITCLSSQKYSIGNE